MAKVLIIDDDKDISHLIEILLRKEKIDSEVYNNPLDALNVIDDTFDLVLLDIMMPQMSGTEFCLKVRDKISSPIVFLSAKSTILDKMVCFEMGGDDYITKPFNNDELILKVKSVERRDNNLRI